MQKRKVRVPFFTVNPKAYIFGDEALKLAKKADELAEKYDIDVFFTAQHVDLKQIKDNTKNLIVTAQHLDGLKKGAGMGHILGDALVNVGVEATFLNHAEHAMTMSQLAKAMARCNELGILTIVCADSIEEAEALAKLDPDIMVCEPTSLIGTGKVSDENYMVTTNNAVKGVSPNTLVLQAAGISSGKNVYDAIMTGADGTGGTSGIVCATDPLKALEEMMEAMDKARTDRGIK